MSEDSKKRPQQGPVSSGGKPTQPDDLDPAPAGITCDRCDGESRPGVSFDVIPTGDGGKRLYEQVREVILCRGCLGSLVGFVDEYWR